MHGKHFQAMIPEGKKVEKVKPTFILVFSLKIFLKLLHREKRPSREEKEQRSELGVAKAAGMWKEVEGRVM